MTAKSLVTVVFGFVMIFAWAVSFRMTRQSRRRAKPGSTVLTYLFTGVITLTELILVVSLLVKG